MSRFSQSSHFLPVQQSSDTLYDPRDDKNGEGQDSRERHAKRGVHRLLRKGQRLERGRLHVELVRQANALAQA